MLPPLGEPGETLSARMAALAAHMTIVTPGGPGPFPAVLQFHGCGGRKHVQDRWAQAFAGAGIAAIVVDSYAHRGIGRVEAYATVCLGLKLQGPERAGDVFAAFAWAREQTFIDPDRIATIGWSHGGWSVLDALALPPASLRRATGLQDLRDEPLAGLAATVAVYPYLGVASAAARTPLRTPTPPILALLGTADAIVGWKAPLQALERHRSAGAPIDIRILEGATHAFDEAEAADLRTRYDPVLTAKTEADVADWLKARFSAR